MYINPLASSSAALPSSIPTRCNVVPEFIENLLSSPFTVMVTASVSLLVISSIKP